MSNTQPRQNDPEITDAETPDEPPPPYREVADPDEVVTDTNFNRPFAALNQATQATQSNHSNFERPPQVPLRPPQAPLRPPQFTNNAAAYQGSSQRTNGYRTSFPPARYQVPWVYPQGYWCHKCNNTGVKLKNGLTCQDCYGRFARQRADVYQSRPGYYSMPVVQSSQAPLVVKPGDPRIGGILCGRCRGRGQIIDLLGEYKCSTCGGIGRLL